MATRTLEPRRIRRVPQSAPVIAPTPSVAQGPLLDRPLFSALPMNSERWLYFGLLVFTAITRFWDLGSRAEHHDESLHVTFSNYLFANGTYVHDPLMHGPFQFHGLAAMDFLFGGANEITGRLLAALFGVALIITPYFLRKELGRAGALMTAFFFALSPLILYYARFSRNESFITVFAMMMVIGAFGYLRTAKLRYLVIMAAGLALNWTAKEVAYIYAALFIVYFAVRVAIRFTGWAGESWSSQGAKGDVGILVVLATLSAPQFSAALEIPPKLLNWGLSQPYPFLGIQSVPGPGGASIQLTGMMVFGAAAVFALLAISAFAGMAWNRRDWLICAGVFYGIYLLFFTTFFTNPLGGIASGFWGQLDYWLAQQDVARGTQPGYYYFLLVPLYEFMTVVLGAIAIGAYAFRLFARDVPRWLGDDGGEQASGLRRRFTFSFPQPNFTAFLIFWTVVSFSAYSKAGEKMPWLGVHMALPLAVLAGKFAGEVIASVDWRSILGRRGLLFVVLHVLIVAAGVVLFVQLPKAFSSSSASPTLSDAILRLAIMVLVILAVVGVSAMVRQASPFRPSQGMFLGGLVVLAALTLPTGYRYAFAHSDIPIEMGIYTQTSPRVPEIKSLIDKIADEAGKGQDLKIYVDTTSGFAWPWQWYLRDYRALSWGDGARQDVPPDAAVVLVHANNEDRMRPLLGSFTRIERYPHRWWFPENYRNVMDFLNSFSPEYGAKLTTQASNSESGQPGFTELLEGALTPTGLQNIWGYFFFRELPGQNGNNEKALGSEDGVLYIRKSLLGQESKPAVTPVSLLTFGKPGQGPGEFKEPKGVAVDARGNIFVADTLNHRIQKFSADGTFLAQTGKQGAGNGEFNEPWSVTVDPDGNIYVADVWNYRVQKFTSDLKFILAFGSEGHFNPADPSNPLPAGFYGPRSIAIASDGTLLVTDTGNKRIQRFDRDGKFLTMYGPGTPGLPPFNEPVGITVDAQGRIWIVDTWNQRIQFFDNQFVPLGQISVDGWNGQGLLNKPYIQVSARGDIFVTDPEIHQILRFGPTGTLVNPIGHLGPQPAAFNLPIGIAQDAEGNLYVAEAGNNRIQKIAAPN